MNETRQIDEKTTAIIIKSVKFGYQEVLVDKEDWIRLRMFQWFMKPCGHSLYYVHASIGSRENGLSTILMHRLVMSFPLGVIDHANGDCMDNRKSNLRITTSSNNRRNSTKQVKTKCKFRGVYERNDNIGKFRAQIRFEGKIINIGQFLNQEEAARAYDRMALKNYGEYAVTNFPRESYL